MYKNKVLGLLSWVWLRPCLGEEAKEGFAGLSGNRSLFAPLPACSLQPLPSDDTTEDSVEQTHADASALFLQLTKLPSKTH